MLLVSGAFLISGCANRGANYTPIVDYNGSAAIQVKPICTKYNRYGTCSKTEYIMERNYNADLNACRGIATQSSPTNDALTEGAIGAAIGAASGAAIGAILGKPGTGAAIGAVGGGIGGTAHGGLAGTQKQEQIVRDCMRGRGWNAL